MGCTLTEQIKQKAVSIGFDLVGISPADRFPENSYLMQWLSRGYHGEMGYMERNVHVREDVRNLVTGARSVVSCALNYNTDYPYSIKTDSRTEGWISRYAWGDDYHFTIKEMLEELKMYISDISELELNSRAYVDTGPVLERNYAKYAGVGWIGKNTCLINQHIGSWIFIGELITDLELEYDSPVSDRCGTCTRCIDACPTDALREPYVLDSNRCISYLTIENKKHIPDAVREDIGNNVYGCDICQDVCPWNGKAAKSISTELLPRHGLFSPDPGELAGMDDEDFREIFRKSPVKRSKRRGLIRNALVVIGNSGNQEYIDVVKKCLQDGEALIRQHAVWALWKLFGASCRDILGDMILKEKDQNVRREIENILNKIDNTVYNTE